MYQVTLDKAQTRLLDLVAAVFKGEKVFILTDDQKAVQLIPVEAPVRNPRFGSAKGLVIMADDFDAPLEDFDEYMS
ncbi:MAG: DUF2281 domain-containing protein [Chloroflexota bacterium]|nr:DUF2281 domain-containing protein [Chloroflexota bacterium]